MRIQGKIAKWKEERAFGFITPNGGGPDIFVHKNGLSRRSRMPTVGEIVTFEVVSTVGGKIWAENVLFQGESDPRRNAIVVDVLLVILAILFLTAITALVVRDLLPPPVLAVYVCVSLLTFIVYRFDKSAAEFNDWRTPEIHLHTLSILGGWPGAIIAQRLLRHKSKKQSFQVIFWATVVLNATLLAALLSPAGKHFLRSLLLGL
jgi:uncharacterized membrane protein YsdA (DUF1294 family)/cold shock CspA family protein